MIEIKPTVNYQFEYPECHTQDIVVKQLLFSGMHVLAKCVCQSTGTNFYHTLPTGHAAYYPIAFSADNHRLICNEEARTWLAQPLRDSILAQKKVAVNIQKEVYLSFRSVIILNCLDDCYGHMLYKLFNAQRHLLHHKQYGLILIIHRSLRWLVPEGVAEIWWVDTPIQQLNQWLDKLDVFVQRELKHFDHVYLSAAVMYLDLAKIDIAAFTKVRPFALKEFIATSPQVTFVCREDRFWLPNWWDSYFYLLTVKLKCLPVARRYFVRQQNKAIQKVVRSIRKHRADTRFFAIGLGRTGRLGSDIIDHRVVEPVSSETERQWATVCATSHVAVGVHGSGMLIPTALAAAFINMIPVYKIKHLGEDIVPRHSPSTMPFLGRFLDASASPKRVAHHIVEVISGFTNHCLRVDLLRQVVIDNTRESR